jgi:hypothetical protein
MEVSGQLHEPPALTPGKEPAFPVECEAEWTPEPVWLLWRLGKYLVPTDLNCMGSIQCLVSESWEHGHEPLGIMKNGKFLHYNRRISSSQKGISSLESVSHFVREKAYSCTKNITRMQDNF